MKKNNFHSLSVVVLSYCLLFPVVSFAAFEGVNGLLTGFGDLVTKAIPIAFGLALLFFFYGAALYIMRAGDEKQAKEGKSILIYGVIALFVMVSIWGIIKFIGDELTIKTPAGSSSNSSSSNILTPCNPADPAGCE